MGRPRSDRPTSRRHLILSDENWEWLTQTFGPTLGVSKAADTIIGSYRKRIESKAAVSATPLSETKHDDLPELADLLGTVADPSHA